MPATGPISYRPSKSSWGFPALNAGVVLMVTAIILSRLRKNSSRPDRGPGGLQAALVLAAGYADQPLLHDPTVERVRVRERRNRRQRDLRAAGPYSRPTHRDLPTAQHHFTGHRAGARRLAIRLMLVAGPADGRAIVFQHLLKHLEPRGDRELHQLRSGVDEQIYEGQVAWGLRCGLAQPIDCATLPFHGGSLSVRLAPRVWSPVV